MSIKDRVNILYSHMLKSLLLCCICLLYAAPSLAEKSFVKSNDYVLAINSYTEVDPWSLRMVSSVMEYMQRKPELVLFTEHMNMLMVDNDTVLNEFKDLVFAKYKEKAPRMILLLGNPSLILRDDLKKQWGDIPIIFCAEEDYTGPQEAYLKKTPIADSDRIPVSSLADRYNLVLLHSNLFVKENVKLISQLVPKMKKFIFVGDKRQINQSNSLVIGEELKKNYPHVTYRFFSPDQMTTNQLLDSLSFIDPQTTGALYSSWFYKQIFTRHASVSSNSHWLIATTPTPLFSLGMMTVKDSRVGFLGGYSYDQDAYNRKIIETIEAICHGKQAREIPFYEPDDAAPTINYTELLRKGVSPDLCPKETVFFNKPLTFWEKYEWPIITMLFFTLLIVLLFQYRIWNLNRLKKAQQKELDAMTSYGNLINNMPILYMQEELITDETGLGIDLNFCNVNTYFEKLFYKREEVVGKKASEIFPESLSEFLPFIEMSLKESRAITFPYYFKQIDRFFDIMLRGTQHSNIIDIFCLDSTELHKAQQKLSATNNKLVMALDVANIVPWKWNLQTKTILCDINKPIELGMRGQNFDEEQLSVPDTQYFSKIFKGDRERVEKAYEELIEGRLEKVKEEYRVVNVQNNIHKIDWVEAQAAVESRDENGKPLTLVGSSLVITKRKKMEMELTNARDRAEESNRLKSAFLANMSHEIRTPLNAIVGFSGILASTDEEEEKQEYMNIIENNNTLLLQLISDILDLSKIEAGTLEFQFSNVDLNRLMSELAQSMEYKLTSDEVKLNFHPTMDTCLIYTERNRLSQLLINLINNAIKFTTVGSIDFGYEHRDSELYFYVSDTGCGIAQEQQQSIFGRFVKLNSFKQGTGLGLSICQTLVERMGGSIGVESEEGKGSTFWFTLPYNMASAADKEVRDVVVEPISIEKDKLTILIAEDNESNYKLFVSILKSEYQLIHAWDGLEAVEMFKKYNPQIILMDINMPVMDGYEAAKHIRKYSAKVPIIAVTAFAYASDEQRVMESGFDGYMPKPINARQLKAQLTDIMQSRIILL